MFTPEYLATLSAIKHLVANPSEKVYMCTPIHTIGSYPCPIHSKMAVYGGQQSGTIGGGNIEYSVRNFIEQAKDMLTSACMFTYSMTAESVDSVGMACGGEVTVLIVQVNLEYLYCLKQALDLGGRAEEFKWTSQIEPMEEIAALARKSFIKLVYLQDFTQQFLEDDIEVALVQNSHSVIRKILGPPSVHIFGGGHVGLCVAKVAVIAGFKVVVYEDRDALIEEIDGVVVNKLDLANQDALNSVCQEIGKKDNQFIVAVTRGHKFDFNVIRAVFNNKMPKYCGMIGSLTKIDKIWTKMREENIDDVEVKIKFVYTPIGLPIGGDQPGQIAVGILAQIIQVLTGGQKRYI